MWPQWKWGWGGTYAIFNIHHPGDALWSGSPGATGEWTGLTRVLPQTQPEAYLTSSNFHSIPCTISPNGLPTNHGPTPYQDALHVQEYCWFKRQKQPCQNYKWGNQQTDCHEKNSTSSSWAASIRKILHLYDLPSAYHLLLHPPRVKMWKKLVKDTVLNYWTSRLKTEAEDMSTTNFVNSANTKLGVLHKSLIGDSNQHDVTRTTVATKLMVRRYPLSAIRVCGKKMEHCIPCGKDMEDEKHFLLLCEALQETRLPHLQLFAQDMSWERH